MTGRILIASQIKRSAVPSGLVGCLRGFLALKRRAIFGSSRSGLRGGGEGGFIGRVCTLKGFRSEVALGTLSGARGATRPTLWHYFDGSDWRVQSVAMRQGIF